jgi:hypothetical protein
MISFHEDPINQEFKLERYQYHMAALGVFFTWLYQTILMKNTPKFGLYIEMLVKVLITFINFVLAYVFLLLAFAISFYILFPDYPAFDHNLLAAFVKVTKLQIEMVFNMVNEKHF